MSYLKIGDKAPEINSIDQKKAIYEVRLEYDYSKRYDKTAYEKLYNIADGTIIFEDIGGWSIDVCIFLAQIYNYTYFFIVFMFLSN